METSNRSEPNPNPDVEHFQQLADGAPVMIWMAGKDMGCFYFNRAWLDYRARTLEQESGNGWAEGVHPDDLERCVQHYISSFERRVSFAMSYRLQHFSGEYRWILDRGVPHFTTEGEFLGFYGGCAVTPAEVAVERIAELRGTLNQMRDFAERLGATESRAVRDPSGKERQTLEAKSRHLDSQHRARAHAAEELSKLAVDMLKYDRIANGECLQSV